MGFEPTTFPVLPGRPHQPLNHASILPRFYLALSPDRFRPGGVWFGIPQRPGAPILQGFRPIGIVIGQASFDVVRLTDVEASGGLTLEDIYEIH